MRLINALGVALLVSAIGAAPAFAAGNKMLEHADKMLEGAKTSLAQAITTSEEQVGGKALSAGLARMHDRDFYDVRVLKGGEVTDVRIGIDDGKVMSTHPMEHAHAGKHKPSTSDKSEQPESRG
jgi:hypothetical protein